MSRKIRHIVGHAITHCNRVGYDGTTMTAAAPGPMAITRPCRRSGVGSAGASPRMLVLLTAHGTIETAVEEVQRGAFDYLTKPFVRDERRAKIGRALAARRWARDRERLLFVGEGLDLGDRAAPNRSYGVLRPVVA